MMHCAECGYEYEPGVLECADCGRQLRVGRLPADEVAGVTPRSMGKLIPVASPEDETAGVMIRDLLRANDIPAALGSLEISWLDGLASRTMTRGQWGRVLVRESDVEAGKRLIDDYFAAVDEAEDDPGCGEDMA